MRAWRRVGSGGDGSADASSCFCDDTLKASEMFLERQEACDEQWSGRGCTDML